MMPVFLDTETTGLIDADDQVLFHSLINPEKSIPIRVRSLTGFTDEMVKQQPTLNQVLENLKDIFLGFGPVVIYNEKYDRRFFPEAFWNDIHSICALNAFRKITGSAAKL